MTNPTPLSRAAQAVLAATTTVGLGPFVGRAAAAASLRAAADHAVPECCLEHQSNDSEWQTGFIDANCRIRAELLAIATELEGANDR